MGGGASYQPNTKKIYAAGVLTEEQERDFRQKLVSTILVVPHGSSCFHPSVMMV